MTTDNLVIVPPGQASVTEPVQPKVEVAPETTKPVEPQPLTAETVQRMIEEATVKAVVQAKELGRRELQSEQDRNRAEIERLSRRAQSAERTSGAIRAQAQRLDPDVAKEMELAELRARELEHRTAEQEEAMVKQQTEFHQQFHSGLTQFITGLGLDPTDKRIDWAGDAPNYLVAQQRVLDSVSKIQKENVQTMQSGLEKRLRELEAKANIEANSVNTATSQGVTTGPDAEFVKQFGAGSIPLTKANVERYQKIQNTY